MSKTGQGLGKPLKGISSLANSLGSGLEDSIINKISSGAVALTNVTITGGVIDGVTQGQDVPGPIFATTITSGTSTGTGFDIIFYGQTTGEYVTWNPTVGLWEVSGDLSVSQITDLGNIRISGNTISTTNTNGDIVFDPDGNGGISVIGDLNQSTTIGNVTFQSSDGFFSTDVSGDISLTSNTGNFSTLTQEQQNLISNNGDIVIQSGASKTVSNITFISGGGTPTITTASQHNLEVGDDLRFLGTNSIPNIDGDYIVSQIVDDLNFKITPGFNVLGTGNAGSFTKNTDIFLSASNNINIPYDTKLTFGSDTNYIVDTSSPLNEMSIVANADINITPSSGNDVNLPDDIGLTFGEDTRKIESDGTNLNINSAADIVLTSANSIVNGNLTVENSVVFKDPIITLGESLSDSKDRGIEFNYGPSLGWFGYDDTDGFFTYYLDATNTGEVISGTLGNAKFAQGNFTSLDVSGGTIAAGTIDACNINCNGLLTLSGTLGIKLNTPAGNDILIPQGTFLRFGETGSPSTVIYKEESGIDLILQSQGHLFLTPGDSAHDVILPAGSAVVLNGEGGTQQIESNSSTEMSISSSSFLNLNQTAGGVRLTQGLPLIFNQDENTKITGDSSNNMIVSSGNSINLIPDSGQVTLPIGKRIEFGDPTDYIGTTVLHELVLSTSGTFSSSSVGDTSITSSSGDILLSPVGLSKNVILPQNKKIILGGSGEYIGSDSSNNVSLAASGVVNIVSGLNTDITSGTYINLTPSTYVEIPYNTPLRFGGSSENITGSSGNLTLNSTTSNVSGNLVINGVITDINSTEVTISDPIITLGETVDDNKDRGVEYNYFDGSGKLGYFGLDDTDGYFMYVPDAVNTSEVISGALGNAKFAIGSFTSLNLNDGEISAVNTLSGNNNITIEPGLTSDVIFNMDSGSNISIPPNVDLLFDGEDAKFYSDGTDLHVDVTSPGRFLIDTDTVIDGDLTVTGNVNIVGGATVNLTIERFTVAGGNNSDPNSSSNITFVSVSGLGVATGTMTAGTTDGLLKNIVISNLASGTSYELLFPTGRYIDAVSGTDVAKKMIFDCAGQSAQFVWDASIGSYFLTQGGACVQLI